VADALGVVRLGQSGLEVVVLRGGGVGHRVEGGGVGQLGLRAGGVAGQGVVLGRVGEGRGYAADHVGVDLRAGRGGLEDRAVRRRVLVGRGGVGVVDLRQTPQVVVAVVRGLIALADADLEVERLGRRVPHLVQPGGAVLRFGGQRRRRLGAEGERGGVEQIVGVGGGEGELQVVARVEPAALHVDRSGAGDRYQVAADLVAGASVAVGDEVRGLVHGRAGVVLVRGLAIQARADERGAVALVLVEVHAVGDQRAVEVGGVLDLEGVRGGGDLPGDGDVVRTVRGHGGEVDRVDVGVGGVPRALTRRGDAAARHGRTSGADHLVGLPGQFPGGHEVGGLGVSGQIAGLVGAHLRSVGGQGGRWHDDCGDQSQARGRGERGSLIPASTARSLSCWIHPWLLKNTVNGLIIS